MHTVPFAFPCRDIRVPDSVTTYSNDDIRVDTSGFWRDDFQDIGQVVLEVGLLHEFHYSDGRCTRYFRVNEKYELDEVTPGNINEYGYRNRRLLPIDYKHPQAEK